MCVCLCVRQWKILCFPIKILWSIQVSTTINLIPLVVFGVLVVYSSVPCQ